MKERHKLLVTLSM